MKIKLQLSHLARLDQLLYMAVLLILISSSWSCTTMSLEGQDDPKGELRSLLDELENKNEAERYGEDARRRLAKLSAKYPQDVDIQFSNAVYAAQDGDTASASLHLDTLFRFQAVHPEGAILRAQLALKEGNLRFATRILEEQIRLVPDHSGLRETRASVHFFRAEYEPASKELEQAYKLGAPRWRVAFHQGLIAEAQGMPEVALELFEECIELNPDFKPAISRARALKRSSN